MSLSNKLHPIWKFVSTDLTTATGLTGNIPFRVRYCEKETDAINSDHGIVIYEGLASPAPDTNIAEVSINDIVANYLAAPFRLDGGRWVAQPRLGGWFAIDAFWDAYETGTDVWDLVGYHFFVMDYSYDYDFALASMTLAHPVRAIVAPNQWLVCSFIDVGDEEDVVFTLTFAGGTTQTISVPLAPYAEFNEDFNNDFAVEEGEAAVAGYAALYLGNYAGVVSVQAHCGTIFSPTYIVRQDTCKRYALYYRNAYGGYDSLLLDGAKRAENYARATIGRWADNSVPGQRELHDYRNDIEESWTLRVNALTDEQAERMPQVMGSTDAYLCDLNTNTLIPLLLTDAVCEVKTYRNQGGKRIDYQITAKRAQRRERR